MVLVYAPLAAVAKEVEHRIPVRRIGHLKSQLIQSKELQKWFALPPSLVLGIKRI